MDLKKTSAPIATLPQHVHLLGICGMGMGSLAQLLVEAGHQVTGTDAHVYPPMSDLLRDLGIPVFEGFAAENLHTRPDLVVVGNVISKTNPEAQEALRLGLAQRSMPQALAEFFLEKRTPLVVAGTHGKTTTATLLTWLLTSAGEDPGFLIGGIGNNLNVSARVGTGPCFVVEGDEYDTAYFDKGPKFLHYRPQALLLTSIEFDHADIYRDLDAVKSAFRKLLGIIPPDGLLVANHDDMNVQEVVRHARCRVVTYGLNDGASYRAQIIGTSDQGTEFQLTTPAGIVSFRTTLYGEHNISNAAGCLALLMESGISADKLREGLAQFSGVRRRQEVIGEENMVTVLHDFAHHPTAVAKTITALRARYPNRRLWVIFEPRSNTSRRKVFQNEYVSALSGADRVVIAGVYKSDALPKDERLDPQQLADAIWKNGTDAYCVEGSDFILEFILRGVDAGDVVAFMSNGSFDQLPYRLVNQLPRRKIYTDHSQVKSSRVPKTPR